MSGIKSLRRKAKVTQGELAALIAPRGPLATTKQEEGFLMLQSESGSSARLNSLA